jgi:hypothetical protein
MLIGVDRYGLHVNYSNKKLSKKLD